MNKDSLSLASKTICQRHRYILGVKYRPLKICSFLYHKKESNYKPTIIVSLTDSRRIVRLVEKGELDSSVFKQLTVGSKLCKKCYPQFKTILDETGNLIMILFLI